MFLARGRINLTSEDRGRGDTRYEQRFEQEVGHGKLCGRWLVDTGDSDVAYQQCEFRKESVGGYSWAMYKLECV